MRKTLLLDVDGVLIRDRVLLNHVKSSVVRYVRTKISKDSNPTQVNNFLYKTYGHTAIGLEKEYGVDASDFDHRVYTPHVLDHLYDFLDTTEFQRDANFVREIIDKGHPVELFSNSPLVWSLPVALAIDTKIKTGTYMKPNTESYMKFDPLSEYIFVDDKMCNLMPVLFLENWVPVHFSDQVESKFVKTISSLEELNSSNMLRM